MNANRTTSNNTSHRTQTGISRSIALTFPSSSPASTVGTRCATSPWSASSTAGIALPPQTSSRYGQMGRPRLSLYLCSQFLHAVEHDPADGDQLVDAASVLTLWPEACLSPPRVPQ